MIKDTIDLHALRENYTKGELEVKDLATDPIDQFKKWLDEALSSKILEPNAMVLSTVNTKGLPTSRVVLLKELTVDGIVFYTNYDSDKGMQMADNPSVALNFLWKELERQVRIEGVASKVSREMSENYFNKRPKASRIGAWASPQSKVIDDRSYLEERKIELESKFQNSEVIPLPPNWGGYLVRFDKIEFWQGRRSRLHDRFRYSKEGIDWKIERLAP